MSFENYVAEILEAGDVQDAAQEFDLETIVEEFQKAGYFYSDILEGQEIPEELFWVTIYGNAR